MKKSIKNLTVIAASMLCITCCVETGFVGSNVNDTLNAMAISGELETGVQWNFIESTGVLEFSGNGAVPDCNENFPVYCYSPGFDPAYYEQGEVMSITFSEGITTIGNYACAGTIGDAVTEVSLPDGLTSIGTKAFYFVQGSKETAFKTVTIPESVTYIGEKAIGWHAYYVAINNDVYEEEKVIDGFVIRGYAGTVAEEYAKANGITFEDISGGEIIIEPTTEPTKNCGDDVYWNLDESTGTLTISGTGSMYDYGDWGYDGQIPPWCPEKDYGSNIKKIIIEEGITEIGENCFLGSAVSSVVLPESLEKIGMFAFHNCENLKEITIPANVNEIEKEAFGQYGNSGTHIYDGFKVYGYADSTAQRYVNNVNNLKNVSGQMNFILLNEITTEPPATPEISTEETAKNAIAAYKEVAAVYQKIPGLCSVEFSLYDMNNDGIPELIEKTGTCEADYIYNFITYRNGTIVNIGSDNAGHSALYKDNETGQLCKRYGQNGIGYVVWYTSDGYTIDMTESNKIKFTDIDVENAFATLGSFSKIDSSRNYKSNKDSLDWSYISGIDLIKGFDLSVFDRYDVTNVPSDKDNEPAPAIPTEPASSEENTDIPVTTEKAGTTANSDGKTSSPKTGDKGIILTGTIGLLTGIAAFVSRKKKK